jgi:hypothetical protein
MPESVSLFSQRTLFFSQRNGNKKAKLAALINEANQKELHYAVYNV